MCALVLKNSVEFFLFFRIDFTFDLAYFQLGPARIPYPGMCRVCLRTAETSVLGFARKPVLKRPACREWCLPTGLMQCRSSCWEMKPRAGLTRPICPLACASPGLCPPRTAPLCLLAFLCGAPYRQRHLLCPDCRECWRARLAQSRFCACLLAAEDCRPTAFAVRRCFCSPPLMVAMCSSPCVCACAPVYVRVCVWSARGNKGTTFILRRLPYS